MIAASFSTHEDPELAEELADAFVHELALRWIDFGVAARDAFRRTLITRMCVDFVVDRIRRGFLSFTPPERIDTKRLAAIDDAVFADAIAAHANSSELSADELMRSVIRSYASFDCVIAHGDRRA